MKNYKGVILVLVIKLKKASAADQYPSHCKQLVHTSTTHQSSKAAYKQNKNPTNNHLSIHLKR